METVKKLLVVIGLLSLTACAGVAKAPTHLDQQAKSFKTNSKYAQVYVYRNEYLGGAFSMPVTVNGKLAGETGPKSFFKFNLKPGEYKITSQEDTSSLTINTKPGKNYFVWQEVKMGFFGANSKLQLVDDATGKAGVMECSLIESSIGK